ncbi:alpha/beta fold hydrolase [soil metagenome]
MPYANNDGVRIHYEVVGDGPPLVLQHGYSLRPSQWQHMGFVEPLIAGYRVILIAARGHGKSDKLHDPDAYTDALMASDVVAVLDDLGIDKSHFCGFSMGGRIGLGVAGHYPNRLLSLVAGGSNPSFVPDPADLAEEVALLSHGTDALLRSMEAGGWKLPDWFRESVLSNDPEALIAYRKSRYVESWEPGLLANMTMPCLVFAGELDETHDGAKAAAEKMPNATFLTIPEQGHIIPPELWLPILQDFLKTVPAQ